MEILNRTGLIAAWTVLIDHRAAEQLCVAVRGTWSIDRRGRLTFVPNEPVYQPVDVCHGEPGLSSVLYESDTGPVKPATDCALIGSAVAPEKGARQVDVSFRAGPVQQKARVMGPRKRGALPGFDSTQPFDRVPLLWELAKGGTDFTPEDPSKHVIDLENPYGRGLRGRGSQLPAPELPQILQANGREAAIGFGLTGPQWKHRQKYAGTYDDAWRESQAPLLPEDFDPRFHLAAAPGLSTEKPLVGGEEVEVRGCTREGTLAFKLPRVTPDVRARIPAEEERVRVSLATVTVDTDRMHLRMLWRGSLEVHGRLPRFKQLLVGAKGLE
jgi:hypothetical protein